MLPHLGRIIDVEEISAVLRAARSHPGCGEVGAEG